MWGSGGVGSHALHIYGSSPSPATPDVEIIRVVCYFGVVRIIEEGFGDEDDVDLLSS